MTSRHQALKLLLAIIQQGRNLTDVLAELNAESTIDNSKDKAFIQELCYGVCRWYQQLEWHLQQLLKKPLKDKDLDIKLCIFIGFYQLLYMRVPDHAAIAETVQITKALKKMWATNLVNAVLRNLQRQKESLAKQLLTAPAAAQFSHPAWLLKVLQQAWPEHWQTICTANNQYPPLTLRVNQQKISRDNYLKELAEENIAALPTTHSPYGIRLEDKVAIETLPYFQQGFVSVQDEAAQLAAPLLQLQTGQRVLDACCAPGGKTLHILEQQPQLSACVAIDNSATRLTRVEENLQRHQVTAELICADSGAVDSWWDKKYFDRILLDTPCSATGVIRRHPDIKLLRKATDIIALVKQQQRLLNALWPLLAPGGLLLYVTCSILPEENSEQIAKALQSHSDMQEVVLDDQQWGLSLPFGRQIFPDSQFMDGFYYCLLKKLTYL